MKKKNYLEEQIAKVHVVRPLQARDITKEEFSRHHSNREVCKKVRFRDHQEAVEALHTIERYKKFAGAEGKDISARNERRTYRCERCKGVHLTSQPISWALEAIHAA
jgi:hypothetical protein